MAIAVSRWERRDSADRNALGVAALEYCRSAKGAGATAKFYWTGADSIIVIAESDNPAAFDSPPSAEVARKLFNLADVARQVSAERWIHPRDGAAAYSTAGRLEATRV